MQRKADDMAARRFFSNQVIADIELVVNETIARYRRTGKRAAPSRFIVEAKLGARDAARAPEAAGVELEVGVLNLAPRSSVATALKL